MTREEAIKYIHEWLKDEYALTGADREVLGMAIEALQTEVVRCKDCRYRELDGDVTHYYWCRINERPVDDTDYCAWGMESEVEE